MSTRPVVVDDHLLVRIVLGDAPGALRRRPVLYTTGLWYHRLCRAVNTPSVVGTLSRSLGAADPVIGAKAVEAITALPESIGLVSLRDLAWPMARLLGEGLRLNLLSLEALATAEFLGADLFLGRGDDNRPLREAAEQRRRKVRVIG